MHDAVLDYVGRMVAQHELGGDVLDLGGRDVNGTPRHLFPDTTLYTVVDINDAPNVDIVADAAELDLGYVFDVVVCTEVLEHTERAADIVKSAFRHLKPGGVFVATMAGPGRARHSAHGDSTLRPGEFYENVEPETLAGWLSAAGFASWLLDQDGQDVRCTAFRGR